MGPYLCIIDCHPGIVYPLGLLFLHAGCVNQVGEVAVVVHVGCVAHMALQPFIILILTIGTGFQNTTMNSSRRFDNSRPVAAGLRRMQAI